MLDFGKSLQSAREAKGFSIEQLSEQTHVAAKILRELEAEDFSGFHAPIYGRGFVKLYCNAVGLEPKPFMDEFMEIYNGNRDLTIRERAPVAEPEPPVAVPEPPVATEPVIVEREPIAAEPPPFDLDRQNSILERPAAPAAEPPPVVTEDNTLNLVSETVQAPRPRESIFDENRYLQRAASRYAAPAYDEPAPRRTFTLAIPPAVWRLTLLALVVAGLLWAAFVGLKALHRSTCGEDLAEAVVTETPTATVKPATDTKPKADAKPKADTKPKAEAQPKAAPRTPQKIPPLYID